jgi:tetratricopeptide (TPR) repeat protein
MTASLSCARPTLQTRQGGYALPIVKRCIVSAVLCLLANAPQAAELLQDEKNIISRGHGAYEVGQQVYFVVEAGKKADRTKEVFLKIDDKLSHLVLDFTTRVTDSEKTILRDHVHPSAFADLLTAIKLDRRRTPVINAKQIWLSEDGWSAMYKAERRDIEAVREKFPVNDFAYAHQILVRLYYASSAWKKLTEYYWRNALYDDALITVSRSSDEVRRALSVAYPEFSEDPMVNAMRILQLGVETFKRKDLIETAATSVMPLSKKAAHALQIFATFPALNSKGIDDRIAYLRQLEATAEWQEYLDSLKDSITNSLNIEWMSIASELHAFIPLYTMRTAGTLRLSPSKRASSKHASFQAQSHDPMKRLESALVFVQSEFENKDAWVKLGDAMLAIKRQSEALAIYRVALSFEPGDLRLRELISSLYEKLGLQLLSQSMKSSVQRHARLNNLSVSLQ